jgi:hypothetical protein
VLLKLWSPFTTSIEERERCYSFIFNTLKLYKRMHERRLTKEIYEAGVGGNAERGRPRRTFLDQIGEVLEKDQVKSTGIRRGCTRNLMKVEEAK